MAQQPQDPWGTPEIGAAPAPAQTTPAGGTPPAPAGATADPWGKAEIGAPAPPAAPMDANGQPIHHYQVPQTPGQPQATATAGHRSFIDRVEDMFRYANPNWRPHSSDKDRADTSMTLIRPEEFMSETEQAQHPVLTAEGQFTSGMTSPESLSIMAATFGMGEVAPVFSRLVSLGFSGQMIKGAYDQYPEFKAAMDRGDASEAKRIATHIILDASMAFFAGKHAIKGGGVSGKPTQYEKANPELMQERTPEFIRAQKGPAGPNVIRPTTENVAGVDVPVTAKQAAPTVGPSQTVLRTVASFLAGRGGSSKFQAEQTKPAGTAAAISALSQSAEDKIARHDALVNGRPAPESIAGTDTPGRYTDPDHIWSAMQTASEPTWEKARDASSNETKQWEQQRDSAIQAHKEAVDYFNQRASEHNASLGEGEEPIPLETFRPEDARIPPKPETFDELRDKVRDAKARAAGGPQVPLEDQTKAKEVDLPKAEKNLDKWFADHDQIVSNAEYESAKKLRAESGDFQDIADTLRTRLLQDKLNSDSIKGLEGKVDGKAIRERGPAGIGTFRRLVGEDTYQNLQRVAELFKPTEKGKSGSLGEHMLEYGTGIVAFLMHHMTGGLTAIGGELIARKLANEALFNPEFGKTFARVGSAVSDSYRTMKAVPSDIIGKFTDHLKGIADDLWKDEQGKLGLPGSVPHPSDLAKAQAAAPAPAETPVEAPVQTPVESQPVAPEPAPSAAPQESIGPGHNPEQEISTRTMIKSPNNVLEPNQVPNNPVEHVTGWDAIEQAEKAKPGHIAAILDKLSKYKDLGVVLTPEDMENPRQGLEKIINHFADNLVDMYNRIPEPIRNVTKTWYDSANKMANTWAKQYGVTAQKVAGVIAALSPKNAWDNNAGVAERMVDIFTNKQDHAWTAEMSNNLKRIRDVQNKFIAKQEAAGKSPDTSFRDVLNGIEGKTWQQITDDVNNIPDSEWQKVVDAYANRKQSIKTDIAHVKEDELNFRLATWMRILDEAHGSRTVPLYRPDGSIRGSVTRQWGMMDPVIKALEMLKSDGSTEAIHRIIGDGHKIRNFYNNIISPNSPNGHATIDTHAANADMLVPRGSSDEEVTGVFGGAPSHAGTGQAGMYSLHHEAYQRAAERAKVLPREMQSITWEGVKSLMGDEKKTDALKQAVSSIWQAVRQGGLTIEEARDRIYKVAGGFSKPPWMPEEEWQAVQGAANAKIGNPDLNASARGTANSAVVPELRNTGAEPGSEGTAPGGRGATAGAVPEGTRTGAERPDLAKVKAAKVPKRKK